MSCGKVKNPPGFGLCRVAKSKTRQVLRHVAWQSPKPAGFRAMLCGKVQNSPGFAPCRVTESKTRQVLRYVEWQSPKPGGFWVYPYWENVKPAKFCTYPCRGAKAYAPKCPSTGVCAQNPPNFARIRVGAYCIRPKKTSPKV